MPLPMLLDEQMNTGKPAMIEPLSVEQYHQMIATGILREGDSIELIDGILIRKDRADTGGDPMSYGVRHGFAVVGMQECLADVKGAGCHVRSQVPVTIGGTQEPEPDIGVIRGPRRAFADRHPGPADIVALIEVSDSSLTFDRTTKQRLYANAAIPIYWIVNLVDKQIEVYHDPLPGDGKYASRTDYQVGQVATLVLGPGAIIEVAVADVLPG